MKKRAAIIALAAAMLVGNTVSVNAAGLRDVFSAEYYASQYPDLKAVYGNDEEALYQHFLKYGLKEGRNMSPVLNVQEYRAKYADLDAAFGDNWAAYVNHFFTYGIKEKRDNGTDFDIYAYLESYADIKAVFGTDYLAAAKHYMNYGIKENRQEASKAYAAYVQEQQAAAEAAAEEAERQEREEAGKQEPGNGTESDTAQKPEDSTSQQPDDGTKVTEYPSGLKVEDYYDEEGVLVKTVHYAPNGNETTITYGGGFGDFKYNGKQARDIVVHNTEVDKVLPILMVIDDGAANAVNLYLTKSSIIAGFSEVKNLYLELAVNEEGNYVFMVDHSKKFSDRSWELAVEAGVTYIYSPNGEQLSQE